MRKIRLLFPGNNFNEWAIFFIPTVLLLIPFTNFAKSNSYPIFAPETLLIVFVFFCTGLLLGVIGQAGPLLQAFTFAATLTLAIDIQTTWFFDYNLHQYIWLPISVYVLTLICPVYIKTFTLVAIYATWIAILATPESSPIETRTSNLNLSNRIPPLTKKKTNSIWIHIIVDEHIGIESIPVQFDPNHRLADQIKNDYVDNGFIVYGRAFTRFSQTHTSLPNILNLAHQHPRNFITHDSDASKTFLLTESKYLNRLNQQGFDTHVYSMDYLKICNVRGDEFANVCSQYGANTIWGLNESTLTVTEKTLLILRIYARLSKVYDKLVRSTAIDKRLSIPDSVTSLMGRKVLTQFGKDILAAETDTAWLVHIPLPHYPYTFKQDCSIKSFPWQVGGGDSEFYEKYSADARQEKYPLYLEQVECVNQLLQALFTSLKDSGIYEKSHIVVHGDHGSRIATHNLRERPSYRSDFKPSAETMVDYFGTLFAYKPAGKPKGEYRRDIMSVTSLLDKASAGQLIENDFAVPTPEVYLVEWRGEACRDDVAKETKGCRLLPYTMPAFSYGKVGADINQ